MALALSTACLVPESEFQELSKRFEDLKTGIDEVRHENEVLKKAILEAYKEREALVAQLEDIKQEMNRLARVDTGEKVEHKEAVKEKPAVTEPAASDPPVDREEPETEDEPPEPDAIQYYYASPNDTLADVARRTGIPLSRLQELNGIGESAVLQKGQRIRVR